MRIDERYINILIPYAFNDLAKRGFRPISSALYNKKLKELGLAPEQRQKQPYIYEYKHYFSSPTIMQGWTDDIAEDGIDKKNMNIFDTLLSVIYLSWAIISAYRNLCWIPF